MSDGGINGAEGGVVGVLLTAAAWVGKEVWTAWRASRRTPEQKAKDEADLDQQSVMTASGLMAGMRQDIDALRREMMRMKANHAREIAALKASHDECEQRCTAVTGELRQLQMSNQQLRELFKDPATTKQGGELEGAIVEFTPAGQVLVTPRDTPRKRRS